MMRCLTRELRLRNVAHVPGQIRQNAPAPTGEQHQILAPDSITAQTPYGELVRLAPPVKFSETKPYWEDPVLVVRGSSKAQWKDS
jgi:hypothetical protein